MIKTSDYLCSLINNNLQITSITFISQRVLNRYMYTKYRAFGFWPILSPNFTYSGWIFGNLIHIFLNTAKVSRIPARDCSGIPTSFQKCFLFRVFLEAVIVWVWWETVFNDDDPLPYPLPSFLSSQWGGKQESNSSVVLSKATGKIASIFTQTSDPNDR